MASTRSSFVDCTTPDDKKDNDEIQIKITTKPKKKKSKTKKNQILYQQTAIKYYDGFTKNKRFNKGISLSTGCAIFKTAWELPENNGLILPSRIIRHFKQVLPKKPKKEKKKKKSKKADATTTNTKNNDKNLSNDGQTLSPIPNANMPSKHFQKSRTMMEISVPKSIQLMAKDVLSGSKKNSKIYSLENTLVQNKQDNEQIFDENNKLMAKITNVRSKSTDLSDLNMENEIISSPIANNIRFRDHAHIIEDDLKAEPAEIPKMKQRSQTERDVTNMDIESISFEKESTKKVIKKKKKKQQILYAEDATKLFKKINDGKRFKNGIKLDKACNIFSVAWELPEENGRILPSKIARHFKQVLPSKKTMKKKKVKSKNAVVNKEEKRNSNIKPSLIKIIKTDMDKEEEDEAEHEENILIKPHTMRGHMNHRSVYSFENTRRTININSPPHKGVHFEEINKNGKNPMSDLERMIAADKYRNNDENDDKDQMSKRRKAQSMHHIDVGGLLNSSQSVDKDQIVENEIEQMIKEKKKLKEQNKRVENAIESALGL